MKKIFSTTIAGRQLTIETGELAQLANGAVLVRYGDTVVLSAVTASAKPREGIDFFPLSVDFEEKLYSVGKIPGSFMKREGRPSETAVLISRAIDRPMRPLFPKDLRNDVALVNTVLSCDQDYSAEFAAMVGASTAVAISDIPFNGPLAAVIIGLVDGEAVINPDAAQREKSQMYVTLAGTKKKVCMIEAGANEVPDDVMIDAIKKGHAVIAEICAFIEGIAAEVGKPKFAYESSDIPEAVFAEIKKLGYEEMKVAVLSDIKQVRDVQVDALTAKMVETFQGYENADEYLKWVKEGIYKLEKKVVREFLFKEHKRVDGRSLSDIRALSGEVGILPRVHGSGLFQRGQTQVLTIATLGPIGEAQKIDGIDLDEPKRYMHHYNFPPYSVGEAKTSRGPGRREIGHGALAERALEPVLPKVEDFPYAMRLVSEVTMSNGSTSQGSVCGSTLALMDAGVPISAPVAGISCGLIVDENDDSKFITFMDIQGIEDFFGDMDFKVAGTKKGITAIQVDIKVDGLSEEIIKEAFEITKTGREHIIDDVILKIIPAPRAEVSQYAPKMLSMQIDPEKIRDVIGSGGKVINKIIAETGVKIDINEDGKVYVSCIDIEAGRKAIKIIEGIAGDIEVGTIYTGKVTRLMNFGAFVEFLPGKEGLVHISKLDTKRVEKVEDVVAVGDEITVKVMEVDQQGRINLSRKDAMPRN
ncbi:MAG: polyribonucleotide nucleotidyltransferase [Clostridia bacterium]